MPYAYNSAEGIDPSPLIRRDRQTREMDTAQEIMGSTGQEEEEHSFQNVGTKSLKKIRKTFSSAIPRDVQSNSSSTSAVVEEENEEQKNSQAEEQGTITKDCNDEGENKELGNNAAQIFSCTSEENGLDEGKSGGGRREKVKKKSWSEIVGSSSSSASSFRENNKDNGTFLQKKGLDQHEDSLVKPNIISHTESTRENDAMHYANTNIYPTEMLLAVQYQLQNHNNRISNSIPSNLDDNLGYDNESKVTILKYPVEDKSSTASAVVESHQQKEIEQGLEAVQGMAGDDNVHQRNKKDANGEEDEQPSCTESFKQLNPFDFTTHVGKVELTT